MTTVPTDRLRPAQRPAVLVTSGAFNPVHRNHLRYVDAARGFLQQRPPTGAVRGGAGPDLPLEIVGGYICALPDRMVARQRGGAIPRAHRSAMLQLATAASGWLMVVDADLHGVRLFETVAREASAALGRPVPVIAVCGADGFQASDRFLPENIPLACVRRTGADDEWSTLWDQAAPARRLYLVEDNLQPHNQSATQVRDWLRRTDDAAALAQLRATLHPDVLDYLLTHPEAHAH